MRDTPHLAVMRPDSTVKSHGSFRVRQDPFSVLDGGGHGR